MSIPDAAIEAAAKAHGEHRIQTEPSSPGYRFAYCICRWRSPDVLSDEATGLGLMHEASYVIEAAMPAIREALAQEIEATKPGDELVMCECGHDVGGDHNSNGCYAVVTYQPMVRCSCKKDDGQHLGDLATDNAARIVRGGAQ